MLQLIIYDISERVFRMNDFQNYEALIQCLNTVSKGKEKINISDLARIFNVSSETLRKYDTQNILIPYREDNLYRIYSSWELTKLIRTRQLRMEGYSIKDIEQHFKAIQFEDNLINIENREIEIQHEIEEREKLLLWLKERKQTIRDTQEIKDKVVIRKAEKLYCCVYMVDNTMVSKDKKQMNYLKEWLSVLPYLTVYYIGIVGGSKVLSCVGVSEREKELYKLNDLVPDFVLPEAEVAVCNMNTYKGEQIDTSNENIMESFEKVQKAGYTHQNIFVIKMIEYTQKDGLYTCLNQAMIPIVQG